MKNTLKKAYEAYWWMADHHPWVSKSLDVHIAKVNPKTRRISDDEKKNTLVEYWLEAGPFFDMGYSHDLRLDCGGKSFEEAIIKLAARVRRVYGASTDLHGHKIRKPSPKSP